jgi:hypothetical protein
LSGLLLLYHYCNFNETVQDWSVAQVLAHIAWVFWLNDFWLSYGPLIKRCFFSVLPDTQKLVRTTPHKLLVQFCPNFTGMISTKSSWALSVCHKTCPNMKLAIMRRHMWSLIALVYVILTLAIIMMIIDIFIMVTDFNHFFLVVCSHFCQTDGLGLAR